MPKLILEDKKSEPLTVVIEDKEYTIPLGTTLTRKELIKLKEEEEIYKFFKRYIPEDVFENIPMKYVNQIAKAWSEATSKDNGISLEKSSASPN